MAMTLHKVNVGLGPRFGILLMGALALLGVFGFLDGVEEIGTAYLFCAVRDHLHIERGICGMTVGGIALFIALRYLYRWRVARQTTRPAQRTEVRHQTVGVLQLSAGSGHVCALLDTGGVRCWGSGSDGKLGYANEESIGDDEHPFTAGDVNVGGAVVQVVAGAYHTCALLEGGAVRCWGDASSGALGSGNDDNIGDDEEPAIAGEVEIGGPVVQLAVGSRATCALLEGGALRCWGLNTLGKLGYGHTNTIGDDETPASAGDVNVGGAVIQVSMGPGHTCVVLDTGGVKCWGNGQLGCLGYASVSNIGDDEEPADYGEINIGGTAVQVGTGDRYTCVLLDTGGVKCWGWAQSGQLGYANTITIGDNEVPATVGEVDVGGVVTRLSVGRHSTCVQVDGAARCWGRGLNGALGYGNTYNVGDNGVPAAAGDVDVGGGSPVDMISSGQYRVCVVLESGALRCWGLGSSGMLGHANTQTIGDNELPAMAGNVLIF